MPEVTDTNEQRPSRPLTRRAALTVLWGSMAVLWVCDVVSVEASSAYQGPGAWWLLAPGVVAGVAVLLPDDRLALPWRAGAAVVASVAMTATHLVALEPEFSGWGLLETLCLLLLLGRAAREMRQPWRASALCTALGVAVVVAPLRLRVADNILYSWLLTLAVGGVLGLACYLRVLDGRRRRAVVAVRQNERLALARELHDFVAHHVTGIVVQAQAARTIRETAPEQVDQLLCGIEQAGSETLESMRKLVRVLREDDTGAVRPGELFAELAELVAAFSERDVPATLQVAAGARQVRPDPEVETSVRNVVREALTNVRRHASGAPSVLVRLDLAGPEEGPRRLRVEVHNAPPARQPQPNAEPLGGRGGLGLVGLTERTEAVGGSLHAGPAEDGGWRLTAEFPVRDAVAGSSA
ncbi:MULTISPECIES: sensor histidine kinase [Streptomyces]|uniref:sensor histidine kinase n=1 Tax=Streptomyces TaxID=1883 RepID=UPI001F2FA1DC|nr:histidine kinase [Streptomyces sp. NHF165]